ncbi:MAG: hypothetical protein AAFR67_02885, partial [Chloroflexota bacterium]
LLAQANSTHTAESSIHHSLGHNLSDQEVAMTLPGDAKMYRDVVHPDYDPMNGELTIPPYGYYWLVPEA